MLVFLDCVFFSPPLSLLLFERKSYAFLFVVFEMHFVFVYISLCSMVQLFVFVFFSCSTVPVIHSTEAGLRRVLCDQFRAFFFAICMFFYYYPFFCYLLWMVFFFVHLYDIVL
jgi:hypothetical protein